MGDFIQEMSSVPDTFVRSPPVSGGKDGKKSLPFDQLQRRETEDATTQRLIQQIDCFRDSLLEKPKVRNFNGPLSKRLADPLAH